MFHVIKTQKNERTIVAEAVSEKLGRIKAMSEAKKMEISDDIALRYFPLCIEVIEYDKTGAYSILASFMVQRFDIQ